MSVQKSQFTFAPSEYERPTPIERGGDGADESPPTPTRIAARRDASPVGGGSRRPSKSGKGKTYRYRSATGSRKLRLEKEWLLGVAAENQRLLSNLNRIYNGRRRSIDNGPHIANDGQRVGSYSGPPVFPHIDVGRATKISSENATTTASRHVHVVAAVRNAIAASDSKYMGTLTLPIRSAQGGREQCESF